MVFENRQSETATKFINKNSLFILLLGFIRRLELKPISEQKVENIFAALPYCQTACYGQFLILYILLANKFGVKICISSKHSQWVC